MTRKEEKERDGEDKGKEEAELRAWLSQFFRFWPTSNKFQIYSATVRHTDCNEAEQLQASVGQSVNTFGKDSHGFYDVINDAINHHIDCTSGEFFLYWGDLTY